MTSNMSNDLNNDMSDQQNKGLEAFAKDFEFKRNGSYAGVGHSRFS